MKGQKLSLFTYTNAEKVELIQNGKSLGRKQNNLKNPKERNQIKWDDIVYQPGTLEAVAWNGDRIVARHKIETTGEAKKLVPTSDNAEWKADGMDLQHVTFTAVDSKGRRVSTAVGEVSFKVDGNAQIVGVINGDINSNEMTVGNKRSLFNGSCTVILRSTREKGSVVLTASMPGMKSISQKFQTK